MLPWVQARQLPQELPVTGSGSAPGHLTKISELQNQDIRRKQFEAVVLHSHCVTACLYSATSFYYCLNISFAHLGLATWISAAATEDVIARFKLLVGGTTAGWEAQYRGKHSAKLRGDPLWWSKHQSQPSGCSVREEQQCFTTTWLHIASSSHSSVSTSPVSSSQGAWGQKISDVIKQMHRVSHDSHLYLPLTLILTSFLPRSIYILSFTAGPRCFLFGSKEWFDLLPSPFKRSLCENLKTLAALLSEMKYPLHRKRGTIIPSDKVASVSSSSSFGTHPSLHEAISLLTSCYPAAGWPNFGLKEGKGNKVIVPLIINQSFGAVTAVVDKGKLVVMEQSFSLLRLVWFIWWWLDVGPFIPSVHLQPVCAGGEQWQCKDLFLTDVFIIITVIH